MLIFVLVVKDDVFDVVRGGVPEAWDFDGLNFAKLDLACLRCTIFSLVSCRHDEVDRLHIQRVVHKLAFAVAVMSASRRFVVLVVTFLACFVALLGHSAERTASVDGTPRRAQGVHCVGHFDVHGGDGRLLLGAAERGSCLA